MLSVIIFIIPIAITATLMVYVTNRSRWTLEQAVDILRCPEPDLQELIKERMVSYRRKYVIYGPLSFDKYELEQARTLYPEIKRLRAENDEKLHKMAEEAAARINEANRIYREQARLEQEQYERIKRIHETVLENMRKDLKLAYVPLKVIEALQVLGLPKDASFEEVRQQYRQLAKQYHPDAGGNQEQFIKVNAAYTCVVAWIEEHS